MKHIYLVHDHQEDPSIRKHYLESVGFYVTLFSTGEELMKMMENQRPDALVMDILLKGKNGFELCREIRQRYAAREFPIILCTGIYRRQLFHEEAADAGAQALLVRPFNLDDIVQHIYALTGGRPVLS